MTSNILAEDPTAAPASQRADFLANIENARIRQLIGSLGDHPYDWSTIFPRTAGWRARRQVKARVRLLKHIEVWLPLLLYPGETIRFVTRGTLNSWTEQYFLGLVALAINRTTFVVTDMRVILLNTNSKGKPRHMKWQIPYHQITRFTVGGLSSSVKFRLEDGKRFKFAGTPAPDRPLLRQYVNERMEAVREGGLPFPHFRSRDNLCPSCCSPVQPGVHACPTCARRFLRPATAAILSACLPSLGSYYLGHVWIGTMELLGYLFTWMIFAAMLMDMGAQALPFVGTVILITHALDAALTFHVARKGLLPRRNKAPA